MFYQINNFSYDANTGIIYKNHKESKLTKLQKKLLDYFIANPKKIISKETLMQEVWGRIVTDNTINKFISALRGHVEDNSAEPTIIITHFGHGLSFEGESLPQNSSKNYKTIAQPIRTWIIVLTMISAIIGFAVWINLNNALKPTEELFNLQAVEHILVLPIDYTNLDVADLQLTGWDELTQSTFNDRNSEGRMIFAPSKLGNREAIERYWQIDKELVVLKSKIIRNGNIYEAVLQLTQGSKVVDEATLSSNNLNNLLNNQMNYISKYQNNHSEEQAVDAMFIQAIGDIKSGNVGEAKRLLIELLQKQENYYQARFELAKIHIKDKEYNQAISQLKTLKSTSAYQVIGAEIEIALSKIHFIKHEYSQLIDNLKVYQANNLNISEVKKAKIKIQIGNSYLADGDLQNAMKFFHQAILEIHPDFNPDLFAQSYYGQALTLIHESNSKEVYALLEKTLVFARTANNLKYQILALDEMARMLLVSNEWEKGIALKRQAIEIMELESDKSEVAQGLGTLAAFLIQRGYFTEAKKVNDRMGDIASELNLDTLTLSYLHYDAVILLNLFKYQLAEIQIDKQLELAIQKNNYGMQLDNAFLEFELRLARGDIVDFIQEWDRRAQLVKDLGFERYQVYLDLYLARYYKQSNGVEQASILFSKVTELAKASNDIKILVDAQNNLAEMYLEIDAQKSLDILQNIEQYIPDANPFLEIKARALYKLDKNIEALNILNQAKLLYHEAWKSENQTLLEQLEEAVN